MGFWKTCRKNAWVCGLALGALFVGLGAAQGDFEVIFKKAVMICLECIGIG